MNGQASTRATSFRAAPNGPGGSPRRRSATTATRSCPIRKGGRRTSADDLAESLAEDFLQAATSGEGADEAAVDEVVPEELGGPVRRTSAADEFASGTDESNPPDAEAEPLPLSGPGFVGTPNEE